VKPTDGPAEKPALPATQQPATLTDLTARRNGAAGKPASNGNGPVATPKPFDASEPVALRDAAQAPKPGPRPAPPAFNGPFNGGQSNGSSNGHANGSSNGHANGSSNGHEKSSSNGHANSSSNGSSNGKVNGELNGHHDGANDGANADALDGDWTDPGDDGFDTPIFKSLHSAWLSSGNDALPWRTTEIEAGWQVADQVAETSAETEISQSGLPVRRPGTRLVPGGVTDAPTAKVRDADAVRARLAAHASGVSRGRAAANAAPDPSQTEAGS
jgi:hypothetical protein